MPTALENSDYPEDLVIDGVDILQLSDDNLYLRLKELGVSVGPVVDTTRSVYQRKLYRLMKGESDHDINSNASYISNGDPKNGPMTPSAYQRKLSSSGRIDPVREPVAPVAPQKSNTIYATCFEIFMLSFLLIVGYIFFQEIQTYSAAEKEYETSSAQNFVPEV